MNKLISISALTTVAAALTASAALIKLDGTSGLEETQITVGGTNGTTYTIIDVNDADGTTADADGVANGVLELSNDDEYILDNITFVENGVLKIQAGTIIRCEPRSAHTKNDPGALVITRSARIDAQGTRANPIIFTTAALNANNAAAGSSISVQNASTEDAFFTKIADQTSITAGALTSGTFLDADPVNSPLAPAKNFRTTAAGVSPVLQTNSGGDDKYLVTYSETTPEHRSLWGGVVILGSAPTSIALIDSDGNAVPTTKGDITADFLNDIFEGFVEGLNIQQVGERGVYGGLNPNDNSGVMKFVSIRHGGGAIGVANELNGLTMGGVGRGTLIENIEVYANGDDGYEWFGGTVDGKYLISLWNNDDSFDIDEGYTGRLQYLFSLQGDDKLNGDHGGEHDGTDAEHDSINVKAYGSDDSGLGIVPTYVTVYNATYIGGGAYGNIVTDSRANRALRIRDSFNGIYRNSIFSDFKDAPVRDDDSDNVGKLTLENNIITGSGGAAYASVAATMKSGTVPTQWTVADNTVNVDAFAVRRNGQSPFTAAKFDRRGLFNTEVNSVGFDPRPDNSVTAVTASLAGVAPTFFTAASYKGAFSPTATINNIWTGAASSTTNPAWSVFGLKFLDIQ